MAGGSEATGGLDLGAIKVCHAETCMTHAAPMHLGLSPALQPAPLHTLATAPLSWQRMELGCTTCPWGGNMPTPWQLFDPCRLGSNRPCAVQEATAKLKETAQLLKTERELRAANLNPQRPSECGHSMCDT